MSIDNASVQRAYRIKEGVLREIQGDSKMDGVMASLGVPRLVRKRVNHRCRI